METRQSIRHKHHKSSRGSLLKNAPTEISVPSETAEPPKAEQLKKVGRTFLSGRDFIFFNRLFEQVALAWACAARISTDERQLAVCRNSLCGVHAL